jgi:esterase FrsA
MNFTPLITRTLLLVFLTVCTGSWAQIAPPRTWPELKQAVQERVNAQRYPMTGFDAKEVEQILTNINSLDRDEWARAWISDGDHHYQTALKLASKQPSKAREEYFDAWRYYSFGAWPTQNSPEKKRAFELSTQAFRAYAALSSPKIEVLRIPFEGKEIVGYLQNHPW